MYHGVARRHIPFKRLQNVFSQVFSMPLSEGSIGDILERSAQKCTGIYQINKQQISNSSVVGADSVSPCLQTALST